MADLALFNQKFPLLCLSFHFILHPLFFKVMLHKTIPNDDLWCNLAWQHCSKIVWNGYKIVPALKIVTTLINYHKIIILSYLELQAPHRDCMWRTQHKKNPVCFNIPHTYCVIWWTRYNGATWGKTNREYSIMKATRHHLVSAHIIVKTKSSRKLKSRKQNFRDQHVNKICCKDQSIRKPLAIILKICKEMNFNSNEI